MNWQALKLSAAWSATSIASSIRQQFIWILHLEFLVGLVSFIGLICNVLTLPIRFFWVMRSAYVVVARAGYCDQYAWAHINRFWGMK